MTWLAWRQFRAQALVALVVLLALLGMFAITAPPHPEATDTFRWWKLLGTALIGVPAVIGAFWGAPLVAREIEAGTHRLAWTQGVSRTHWLGRKLLLIAAASAFVAGAFSLAYTSWISPLDRAGNRLGTANFGQRGIAPIGYAVFAFVLGVSLGLLMRRTLPAMAVTLVSFFLARFAVQAWVRPLLFRPITLSASPSGADLAGVPAGSWVLSAHTVDSAGRVISQHAQGMDTEGILRACGQPITAAAKRTLHTCVDKLGVHNVIRYHPPSRFWAFQSWETAVFLALSVALAGFCFWWVRRRV